MKKQAQVVVIGGGNMGASVLYHLAHLGWTDTVLVEKSELTSGATWHAAGLVSKMVASHSLGSMHDYAVDLYKRIEGETDTAVSWHGCGSLRVATSDAHMDWIHHTRDVVLARGQEAHIVGPDEVASLNPLYDVKRAGVRGAIFTPDDGHVDPSGTCQAMAKGARQLGAEVITNCRVTDIAQTHKGTWQVTTDLGVIEAEHVVNASGYHARQVGHMVGLELPITTLLHHYIVTDNVPEFEEMDFEIPVTRDDYFCGYVRREQNSALIGLYDKQDPQATWLDGCPWDSSNELFEPNWDGITPWLENCFERMPALTDRGIKRVVNGGITYTPDGSMLLGPAPGLRNFWLACGATVGIAWGPGAGLALAQWIVNGTADVSTRAYDPRRFGVWADAAYAKARAKEDYTLRQAMPYPQHQRHSCRDIKKSAVYGQTAALGAVFEEAGGWERPRLYDTETLDWRQLTNQRQVAKECRAVRQAVGLADLSAFAKFTVEGPNAEAWLNAICANKMPRVGRTCLTLLLNRAGTIEGEATIARIDQNNFYFVTGAPSERRVWDWLTLHCGVPLDGVTLTNVTDDIGIIGCVGPNARTVLGQCTDADLSTQAFPWLSCQAIEIGGIEVRAIRLSFAGELGYELHVSATKLNAVWDVLWKAGSTYGIRAFGTRALDSLRLEKFYRGGHELANDVSHLEVAQEQFASMEKPFVGRDALSGRQRGRKIALLKLPTDAQVPLGGEPVYCANQLMGSISSAAYGHTVGYPIAIAFLDHAATVPGTELSLTVLGQSWPAVVLGDAPWDPGNDRLRV